MYTFFPSFPQLKIHIHTFNVHLCIFYIHTDFQNVDVVDDDEKIIIKKNVCVFKNFLYSQTKFRDEM